MIEIITYVMISEISKIAVKSNAHLVPFKLVETLNALNSNAISQTITGIIIIEKTNNNT
jgi:hypothetical protein